MLNASRNQSVVCFPFPFLSGSFSNPGERNPCSGAASGFGMQSVLPVLNKFLVEPNGNEEKHGESQSLQVRFCFWVEHSVLVRSCALSKATNPPKAHKSAREIPKFLGESLSTGTSTSLEPFGKSFSLKSFSFKSETKEDWSQKLSRIHTKYLEASNNYKHTNMATEGCSTLLCCRLSLKFIQPSHPPVPSLFGMQSWNANRIIFASVNSI